VLETVKEEAMFDLRKAPRMALAIGLAGITLLAMACAGDGRAWVAKGPHTLIAAGESPVDSPARNPDGSVNALIEIPAGSNAKWEVRKEDGALAWEIEDGRPRVVQYLAYPANYGMIPRTLLPTEAGGDGDPLDVLVLGPALPRGALVRVQVVGALRLLDGGEFDDKLIAVAEDSPFASVRDLPDLERQFPGVTQILETWFAHYKGVGEIETRGFDGASEANAILSLAEELYLAR
jgi:inorganic pyrophosphatase